MIKKLKLKHYLTKNSKDSLGDLLARMPVPYEPRRQYRYVLRILNEAENSEWFVNPVYNLSVGGEHTHEDFWVTFRDFIPYPNNGDPLVGMIRNEGEGLIPRNRNTVYTMELEMLDPTGVAVSKWVMSNCSISGVDLDNLEFGQNIEDNCDSVKVLFTPSYTSKIY